MATQWSELISLYLTPLESAPLFAVYSRSDDSDRRSAQISSRKRPKQARSSELVAAILVGEHFSEKSRTPSEIEAYSEAMADMFCAHVKGLQGL
jgi:hypothetical protein